MEFELTPGTIAPSKRQEDVGFDIYITSVDSIIKKGPEEEIVTILFDTGVKVKPFPGTYCEVMLRSSVNKLPVAVWMLNSPAIIDPGYRGTIKIPLTMRAIDEQYFHTNLPIKIAQLVVKQYIDVEATIVDRIVDEEPTVRGSGGFGSTDLPPPTSSGGFGSTNDKAQQSAGEGECASD